MYGNINTSVRGLSDHNPLELKMLKIINRSRPMILNLPLHGFQIINE